MKTHLLSPALSSAPSGGEGASGEPDAALQKVAWKKTQELSCNHQFPCATRLTVMQPVMDHSNAAASPSCPPPQAARLPKLPASPS